MTYSQFRCRSCGGQSVRPILSLGTMPLANALLTADQLGDSEAAYPLDLAFCPDCALVQITQTIDPMALFAEYLYLSSFSDTTLREAEALTDRLVVDRNLYADSLVVEIASNDGYLLQYYQQRGVPVLGIEPAANVAHVAEEERGVPTVREFFGLEAALRLEERIGRADVIHAHNVLAHVADLNGFVQGMRLLLKAGGVAVIEVPYVRDLIDNVEFDTIYHEHLCYFSLIALDRLLARHGLHVSAVERIAIHGGSIRVFAKRAVPGGTPEPRSSAVARMIEEELSLEMHAATYYETFASRVEALRQKLLDVVWRLRADGKRLAAYGAAAKGSTLLNYLGVGAETIEFVVDRSTLKQGRFTPGSHLPIHPPARLLEDSPDYVLLLTWNFADEILQQQYEYRRRGGRFIIPVPEPAVV